MKYFQWTRKVSAVIVVIEYTLAAAISFIRILPCCQVKNQIVYELYNKEVVSSVKLIIFNKMSIFQIEYNLFIFQLIHNCVIITPIASVLYGEFLIFILKYFFI